MANASHILHVRSAGAQMLQGERLFRSLYDRTPLPFLVLTPELRIVDANEAWLSAVGRRRDALAGLDLFVAMPDSPHDLGATGVRNLSASLERALRSGKHDLMPTQRYDVRPEGRPWEMRYWEPTNWAILDESGSVLALVHHVIDVTGSILRAEPIGSSIARRERCADPLISRADLAIANSRQLLEAARNDLLRARLETRKLLPVER